MQLTLELQLWGIEGTNLPITSQQVRGPTHPKAKRSPWQIISQDWKPLCYSEISPLVSRRLERGSPGPSVDSVARVDRANVETVCPRAL